MVIHIQIFAVINHCQPNEDQSYSVIKYKLTISLEIEYLFQSKLLRNFRCYLTFCYVKMGFLNFLFKKSKFYFNYNNYLRFFHRF